MKSLLPSMAALIVAGFPVAPVMAMVLLATSGSVAQAGFTYGSFADVSGLTLNGNASQVGDNVRLTTATSNNFGSAYTTSEVALGSGGSFSTHFQFQLTNPGGVSDPDGAGGDGLMFVLQSDSDTALVDRVFGYSTLPGKSLGIEFDTFYNSNTSDPNGNHVGIDLNGSVVSVATADEPVRFNNGATWNAWVDYNGASKELDVRWSSVDVRPLLAQLTYSIDLENQLGGGAAFVGFSADSEGAWENADIKSWQFSDTAVPEPSSLVIWSAFAIAFGAVRRTEGRRGVGSGLLIGSCVKRFAGSRIFTEPSEGEATRASPRSPRRARGPTLPPAGSGAAGESRLRPNFRQIAKCATRCAFGEISFFSPPAGMIAADYAAERYDINWENESFNNRAPLITPP